MEHYRRLGFADEIRREGLPADYPTDVAYFTRYTGDELARFAFAIIVACDRAHQGDVGLLERRGTAASRLAEIRRSGATPARRALPGIRLSTTAIG